MNKTCLDWLKIFIFYICFYIGLAALWAICLTCFMHTLDPVVPTQQQMFSMLKNNPGMGFWQTSAIDSALIYVNTSNATLYQSLYTSGLVSILNTTYPGPNTTYLKDCTSEDRANYSVGCFFDVSNINSVCNNETDEFGYSIGQPCVFLRLNKIIGWQPLGTLFDGTNSSNEFEFSQIGNHLKTTQTTFDVTNQNIPISCEPETDADYDNVNNITFYPSTGVPSYYYPYWNQVAYQPPGVMAQFDIKPGVVVMLWCKFWTKVTQHDYTDLQGSVHIELFLMNNVGVN